ncbi:MAG: hypothetical protein KC777_13230 [Cyanobacteria bacterium HKST-UBA02]|nr:hypothetical protein [Cyanobacteria bacterium HKST-UBA02]
MPKKKNKTESDEKPTSEESGVITGEPESESESKPEPELEPEPEPEPESKPEPEPESKSKPEPEPVLSEAQIDQLETRLDEQQQKPFNLPSKRVVTILCLALGGLFYLTSLAFTSEVLILLAGMFVFLGIYPETRLKMKNRTTRLAVEFGLIFVTSIVVFLLLKTTLGSDMDQAKVVIIFLTIMAARLIVWPIYTFQDDD